jgi:hypothetical protein
MFHYLRVCQQPFYAPWDGTEFEEWTNGYLQIAKNAILSAQLWREGISLTMYDCQIIFLPLSPGEACVGSRVEEQ